MQFHIRGQNNHVVDIDASETVAEIKVSFLSSGWGGASEICLPNRRQNITLQNYFIIKCNVFQAKLSALENVSADDFYLSCEGKVLASTDAVSALTSFELDFTVPLLGGKVHGSLARAGKC